MLKIIAIFLIVLCLGAVGGTKDQGCVGCSLVVGAIGLLILIFV